MRRGSEVARVCGGLDFAGNLARSLLTSGFFRNAEERFSLPLAMPCLLRLAQKTGGGCRGSPGAPDYEPRVLARTAAPSVATSRLLFDRGHGRPRQTADSSSTPPTARATAPGWSSGTKCLPPSTRSSSAPSS